MTESEGKYADSWRQEHRPGRENRNYGSKWISSPPPFMHLRVNVKLNGKTYTKYYTFIYLKMSSFEDKPHPTDAAFISWVSESESGLG